MLHTLLYTSCLNAPKRRGELGRRNFCKLTVTSKESALLRAYQITHVEDGKMGARDTMRIGSVRQKELTGWVPSTESCFEWSVDEGDRLDAPIHARTPRAIDMHAYGSTATRIDMNSGNRSGVACRAVAHAHAIHILSGPHMYVSCSTTERCWQRRKA